MKKYLISLTALLAVSAFVLMAADIDGNWTATVEGFKGPQTTKLTLKADGTKLTGKMEGGRGGAIDISEGKIEGKSVSFKVVREGKQGSIETEYKGTLTSATELKLTPSGGFGGKGGKAPAEMTFKKE